MIPQEFRALSASWDSTKHLSMGKMILHASLSGLLRNLAHDESAKQVACWRRKHGVGCLELVAAVLVSLLYASAVVQHVWNLLRIAKLCDFCFVLEQLSHL